MTRQAVPNNVPLHRDAKKGGERLGGSAQDGLNVHTQSKVSPKALADSQQHQPEPLSDDKYTFRSTSSLVGQYIFQAQKHIQHNFVFFILFWLENTTFLNGESQCGGNKEAGPLLDFVC